MRKEVSNSGYITMYVYTTIVHHREWKDIKFSEPVLNHLKKNHVFAYVDEYEAKKVGSPGCISKIHPKLVNIPNLKVAVMNGVRMAKCDEKEVGKWKEKHNHMDESTNAVPFSQCLSRPKDGDNHQNAPRLR